MPSSACKKNARNSRAFWALLERDREWPWSAGPRDAVPEAPARHRAPPRSPRAVLPPPFFFFNDTATNEIYTLSLHDALPILRAVWWTCVLGGRASRSLLPPDRHGEN